MGSCRKPQSQRSFDSLEDKTADLFWVDTFQDQNELIFQEQHHAHVPEEVGGSVPRRGRLCAVYLYSSATNGQFRESSYLQSRAAVRRERQRERRWLCSTRSVYETPHLVLYFKATAKQKQAFLRFELNFAAGDNIWLSLPTADGNIGQKIVIKSLEAILPGTVSREQRKNLRQLTKYLQRLQMKYLLRSIQRCSVWVHSGTQQKTLSAILFIHAMSWTPSRTVSCFCVLTRTMIDKSVFS